MQCYCQRYIKYKLSYSALLENSSNHNDLKLINIKKNKKEIKNKRWTIDQDYLLVKQLTKIGKKKAINCKIIDFIKFNFANNKRRKMMTKYI